MPMLKLNPSFPFISAVLMAGAAIASQPGFSPAHRAIAHDMKPGTTHSHGASEHSHPPVEIPAGKPVPSVNLVVRPDAKSGWNLEVKVSNFTFAPERVNTKGTNVNEGHAHLYLNGQKISRLYGNWYHLESLPPGDHTLTVSLNTNDHGQLTHQGQPIQASAKVQVRK